MNRVLPFLLVLATLTVMGCTMVPYYCAQGELSAPITYQEKVIQPLTNLLISHGYIDKEQNIPPRFYGITRYQEGDVEHIKNFSKSWGSDFVDIYVISDINGFVITIITSDIGITEASYIKKSIRKRFAEYFDKKLITIERSPYIYLN